MAEFDLQKRAIDAPAVGFWLIKCHKQGPWSPAAIMLLQTIAEPGEPTNVMERSPHIAAFISGQPVAMDQVWLRRGRPITRTEYARQLAEITDAVRGGRYEPRTKPFEAVDLDRLPIPFAKETA